MFKEEETPKSKLPHTCKTVDNVDTCLACIEDRILEKEHKGEAPDLNDCLRLKEFYGGYW